MQENSSRLSNLQDDEVNLLELWNILWQGKKLILGITCIFAIVSVGYALLQTNIYRAEALLAPIDEEQSSNPFSGQIGVFANIAGINLNQSSIKIQNTLAIMQSRKFVNKYIEDHELAVPILAGKWDQSVGQNVINSAIYNEITQTWIGNGEINTPTKWEIYSAFSDILNIAEDGNTNLITVAIEWSDPAEAARWVNWFVADINKNVKESDLNEANNAISYLREQIETTQLVEMQQVLYQLLAAQMRIVMLADVREEYAFRVIDPAVIPEEKVRPRRALISILGTILGGILAVFSILVRHYFSNHHDADNGTR